MENQPVNLSFVVLPAVESVSFYVNFMSHLVGKRFENKNNRTIHRDVAKTGFLPAEISTEHKYLRLILKVHNPKELAGFINELAEVLVSCILAYGLFTCPLHSNLKFWICFGKALR